MSDENCADCGKPIYGDQGSYYRKEPHEDIGRAYHAQCGDPFGVRSRDAEIKRLQSIVDFVALWCYRKTSAGDHERLSVVTHHPGIKAAAKAAGLTDDVGQSENGK